MSDLGDVGFALAVPDSWRELEVRPGLRDLAIRSLVRAQVSGVPQLADHRGAITRLLNEVAEQAWRAGARFAAVLVQPGPGGPVTASATVSVVPRPPHDGGPGPELDPVAAVLGRLSARPLGAGVDPASTTWSEVATVDLPGAGWAARVRGAEDVDLPGGRGRCAWCSCRRSCRSRGVTRWRWCRVLPPCFPSSRRG